MQSAFVSRHFWHFSCFDCQSKILHFAICLLFLLVSFLECESKCRVNEAKIRIALIMVTWLGSYVYWHILHPHLKNYIKELSFTFNFLHLHQLFGINWRALSQCACWNCWVHIINSETILDMPVLSERWIMKCEIPTPLYSCSPKKVPLYGQAYPYRPCIGSNTYVRRRRESSYSLTVSAYFERFNQFSREQNY